MRTETAGATPVVSLIRGDCLAELFCVTKETAITGRKIIRMIALLFIVAPEYSSRLDDVRALQLTRADKGTSTSGLPQPPRHATIT
jgi:hypothetical protein